MERPHKEVLKKARDGNVASQYDLALRFYHGMGAGRDLKEAAFWFRKAAEQGHAAAQTGLGFSLSKGKGVAQDAAQAVIWYRKAAEQGDANAQSSLAVCLEQGVGVARDAQEAVVWYRKAVEQGHGDAHCNLGHLLIEGAEGVPKDARAGARLLGAAAQEGDAEALKLLSEHADDREVANACCLGCGAICSDCCSRCLVARFCSNECVVRTWPVHKPHCRRWRVVAPSPASTL